MIIIKENNLDLIAKMMINLEKGKLIFDTDGKLVNEEKAFHYIENNGITYKFHSNLFKMHCSREMWLSICSRMKQLIVEYDRKVASLIGYESYYNSNEMEFVKTTYYFHRRFITFIKDIRPVSTSVVYSWCFSDIKCLLNDFKGYKKTDYVAHQLLNFNSIVIDTDDIFNFPPGVTVLNRPFVNNDFTANKYIASHKIINITNLSAFIFKLCRPGLYVEFAESMAIFHTVNPVREEKINNLHIVRCDKSKVSYKDIISIIKKQKKNDRSFVFDELEEARNVACGFPETFNDICSKCKLSLYDEIYALKISGLRSYSYMLMCRYCITYFFGSIKKYKLELLKINHSRKMDEVIKDLPLDLKEKKMLIDLYLNPCKNISGSGYENNNYKGYRNINDFILKKNINAPHDPNKQAFFYTKYDATVPNCLLNLTYY